MENKAFYLYDERMLLHFDTNHVEGTYKHPEIPLRVSCIRDYLD